LPSSARRLPIPGAIVGDLLRRSGGSPAPLPYALDGAPLVGIIEDALEDCRGVGGRMHCDHRSGRR